MLSNSNLNHLNISGASAGPAGNAGVVIVGRQSTANTAASGTLGTLTIGGLDSTSSITSTTANGTAILVAGNVPASGTVAGQLTLGNGPNAGTLTITTAGTAGAAIAGGVGANVTSLVTFNGMTLKAGAPSTNWINGITSAGIGDNGLTVDTNGFGVTIPQGFVAAGAGGITKNGAGTLVLSGANSYGGDTTVNNGELDITGSVSGNVVVNSGATLNHTGTAGSMVVNGGGTVIGEGTINGALTFSGSSRLFIDPTTAGSLSANTADGSGGMIEIAVTSPVVAMGILVLHAGGGITGAPNVNFVTSNRGTLNLVNGNTDLTLDLTGAANLTWKGNDPTNPTFWDVKTTVNWDNAGTPDMFYSGDNVTLDDSASSFNVVIQPASVLPSSVTFNNSTNAYTVGGGAIAGTASLTMTGSNTVTLTANNTYSGGTFISSGTIQLGDGTNATGSLGSGAVMDNGSLVTAYGANNVTLSNAIGGTGTLTKTGSGKVTLTGANSYGGGTTISAGILEIGSGSSLGTGPVADNASLLVSATTTLPNDISGTGNLTVGAGVTTLTGNNSYGATTINTGTTLSVGSGGTNGTLGAGAVSNSGSLVFNRSDPLAVAAQIGGTGSISKLGAGTTTLNGASNSAGSLDIGTNAEGGTLAVGSGASLSVGERWCWDFEHRRDGRRDGCAWRAGCVGRFGFDGERQHDLHRLNRQQWRHERRGFEAAVDEQFDGRHFDDRRRDGRRAQRADHLPGDDAELYRRHHDRNGRDDDDPHAPLDYRRKQVERDDDAGQRQYAGCRGNHRHAAHRDGGGEHDQWWWDGRLHHVGRSVGRHLHRAVERPPGR